MSTNLEYRARERQHERKLCGSSDKMRNASGHQCKVKMSGSEEKWTRTHYYISSKKRVTKKFLEISRCSRAKQWQRNVQKKYAARTKLLFLLVRPIAAVFHRFLALTLLLSITRFYILFEQTLNIIESSAVSPG